MIGRPLLLAAVALGVAIRLLYVVLTRHEGLAGDEIAYSSEGALIAKGFWFDGFLPYGILHATAWKPPVYPLWVGLWYFLLGVHRVRLEAVQAVLCGPATIVVTWALARRLWGERAATAAAFVVAVYPMAWQYEERVYSEALAVPLTGLVLLLVIERTPTPRRAAAVGALLGVLLLTRTSSVLLVPLIWLCWGMGVGARRGTALAALTLACALAVVAPWTIRNEISLHGFVPVSLDEVAAYGTFNATSAHDHQFPYAWRPLEPRDAALFDPQHPLGEVRLYHDLESRTLHYIGRHPFSVVDAFFWNGISRLWELRHPSYALDEVRFEGRTRSVALIGLIMYYVLMPLALIALWRHRRRRTLLLPVMLAALAASVVFTADSGTRYRAPLEPLIVVLACGAAPALDRRRAVGAIGV
ncbi:MAG TPA: glycosyltransferase family 39 protein [Solirubrobacteraceae bacterium]|nr:glycosyltransferase family 39 protein [Solirubrobacteraceae bacterium]